MRNQDFVRPGMVELALKHLPGCGCNLETPDPEATLVQLGCVTGYLVERPAPRKRDLDREHAGLGLACTPCAGPCHIDEATS